MTPDEALARIRDYDGRLNAFVRVFDPPLGDGAGPVFAIKDLFDVKGVPTGGGAKVPLAENPPANAVVVQKLLDAGWRAVGKTQTVELAYKLRAKFPLRAKTFASRVYEYYNPTVEDTVVPAELVVKAK